MRRLIKVKHKATRSTPDTDTKAYATAIVRLLDAYDSLPDDLHRLELAAHAEAFAACSSKTQH